jgi:hypothetical protein
MNALLTRIIIAAACLLPIPHAIAALEFAGVMKSRESVRFVLNDTETKKFSPWLAIGDSYAGCTVVRSEDQDSILVVRSGTGELRLPLRLASTGHGISGAALQKPTSQNTFMLETGADGAIMDFERVKKHLDELRPALRDVYVFVAVPDNAPSGAEELIAFCQPAIRSFGLACEELGLRYAGMRAILPRKAQSR